MSFHDSKNPWKQQSLNLKRALAGLTFMVNSIDGLPTTADSIETATVTSAVQAPVLKSSLSVKATILGSSKEDAFMNSKYVGGMLGIAGEAVILEDVSARLGLFFLLSTGSFSNRYGDEGKAPNLTLLDEAAIEYRPWEPVSLQAGVVFTSLSPFASTLDANGFPGIKESYTTSGDWLKVSFLGIQAMPVSTTRDVKSTESGITSTFIAYGAEVSNNPKNESALTVQASLTHFEFNNLTSSAASDSDGTGNTVIPGERARFVYGFYGTEGGLGTIYKFSNGISLKASGTLLRNELAPDGKNKGYVYSGSVSFPAMKGILSTSAGYFYNESDTVPSAYSDSTRGFNNIFGQYVSVRHTLEKEKLTSFLKYTRMNEIEDKPLRADRDAVSVGLEVSYDVL